MHRKRFVKTDEQPLTTSPGLLFSWLAWLFPEPSLSFDCSLVSVIGCTITFHDKPEGEKESATQKLTLSN